MVHELDGRNSPHSQATDESGVVELYGVMCRGNHNFAKFNKVRLKEDGSPNAEDLRAAWQAGARVFKLTLR